MSADAVGIAGTGYYVPRRILTNIELSKMVETSNEWILERTGISERRIAGPGETVSFMAEQAARAALARAGVSAADLDLIVLGTFTPDQPLPAAACLLQARLGNTRAPSFDVSAACCGFLYGLEIACHFLLSGRDYRIALVVSAEKLSAVTDWQDRNTCVLFGDGAGAAVLKRKTARGLIIDSYLGADGSSAGLLQIPAGGSTLPPSPEVLQRRLNFIRMEGKEVFKLAVASMTRAARVVLERNKLGPENVAWLLPHQANMRIMKSVAKALKIPVEKVFINIDRYGNMSGATIPIGLAEMEEKGLLRPGDHLLTVAFGGGLTWGATLIRW